MGWCTSDLHIPSIVRHTPALQHRARTVTKAMRTLHVSLRGYSIFSFHSLPDLSLKERMDQAGMKKVPVE
ncbi:hypothetical protein vseg_002545 [Gypsophila vaccaria]